MIIDDENDDDDEDEEEEEEAGKDKTDDTRKQVRENSFSVEIHNTAPHLSSFHSRIYKMGRLWGVFFLSQHFTLNILEGDTTTNNNNDNDNDSNLC